jgi:hypothetical protein
MMVAEPLSTAALVERIEATLDRDPDQPWCVHRLYHELVSSADDHERESWLEQTERAAETLVEKGRIRHERISAISIGVHCQDTVYWSLKAGHDRLAEFGPEYESPTVLRRLASHFRCSGL